MIQTAPAPPAPAGFIEAAGHALEYRVFGHRTDHRPRIVLLHEGLGSIAGWRDFPQQLADRVAEPVFVYSRYGYGGSDVLGEPRTDRYMHDEALVVLPELLDRLGIDAPVLVGHSDGASIALIHAGAAARPVAAVAALAPHLFVEPVTVASIRAARAAFDHGDLASRLARHHRDARRTFDGWCDVWLSGRFLDWNIEDAVARIGCPVVVIQGEDDQYGTLAQVDRLVQGCPQAVRVVLAACRHSPHLDQPGATLDAVSHLLARA